MNWQDKQTVQKGNVGERIVRNWIETKGWIVYAPETEGPHAFDRLAVKNKEQIIIVEIKTKPKLTHYNATGFNKRHYEEYIKISEKYGIEVFVFFVDQDLSRTYGACLSELRKPYHAVAENMMYPYSLGRDGSQIIFSMDSMIFICDLTPDEVAELQGLSQRNPAYGPPAA